MERLSFYNEIKKNKRNSIFLIIAIFLILISLGTAISFIFNDQYFFIILIFSVIISFSYIIISYYNSDKISLASVNAKPAPKEKYRQYHNSVEGLSLASGLPKPKLYIINNPQINAFATGRDPKNSAICVTTGTLENLNKQELEGVLAHEMSHIANYDVRFMTLTAVLVGLIAIISQIFLRSLFFSSITGRDRENQNTIFLIIGIALAILAPILVALVQLAISRKREYAADASAVKYMRTPTPLIKALEKIKDKNKKTKIKTSGAVSPLFFTKTSLEKEFFQTHPSLEKRIATLKKL